MPKFLRDKQNQSKKQSKKKTSEQKSRKIFRCVCLSKRARRKKRGNTKPSGWFFCIEGSTHTRHFVHRRHASSLTHGCCIYICICIQHSYIYKHNVCTRKTCIRKRNINSTGGVAIQRARIQSRTGWIHERQQNVYCARVRLLSFASPSTVKWKSIVYEDAFVSKCEPKPNVINVRKKETCTKLIEWCKVHSTFT